MKKFIPYILIVAMVGTFAWLSFSSSVSNVNQAEAESVFDPVIKVGGKIWDVAAGVGSAGYAVATGDWGKIADATIGQMLAWIAHFIWSISSMLFTFSGYLLDYAVDFSVKDFKDHIDQIEVIDTGYKIVLNVANMLFIFILLYIAIKTILGAGGDTKKLLINVILVGLFINFSLFMTKTIIDASNILAMGFYNGIQTEAGETKGGQKIIAQGSIASALMSGLRLQTMIPSSDSEYNKEDPSKGLTNFNIMINYLGGSLMFLVSAFVFLSVALLFIVRFVALLFYMLFSPVAFLGLLLPEFKQYSSKWWSGLQSQALFAPAFLFMAYLISAIINSGQLWDAAGGSKDPASNFYDVISSTGQVGGFGIIMNYVILMALMIGALIMAKKMAGEGSAGMVGYAKKFQGWAQGMAGGIVGRNTIGRGAEFIDKKFDKARERMEESPRGRVALKALGAFGITDNTGVIKDVLGKGKKLKFGGQYSREDIVKERDAQIAEGLKNRKGKSDRLASYIEGLSLKEQFSAYEKMSARDRAEVERTAVTGTPRDLMFKELRKKLSVEESEKTDEANKKASTDQKNRETREDLKRVASGGINPATGIAYTPAEIDNLMTNLKSKETYKLIPAESAHRANPAINPLFNPLIIDRFSTGHLSNLMAEGDLTPAEKLAIKTRVLARAGTAQALWMNQPINLANWS